MFNVRTNILLDRETHNLLLTIAGRERISLGQVIRDAIEKAYKKRDEEIVKRRTELVKQIYKMQNKIKPTRGMDYKKLIVYGRYR